MILQRMRPAGYLPKTTEKKMQKQNDSVNLQWNTDSSCDFKFFSLEILLPLASPHWLLATFPLASHPRTSLRLPNESNFRDQHLHECHLHERYESKRPLNCWRVHKMKSLFSLEERELKNVSKANKTKNSTETGHKGKIPQNQCFLVENQLFKKLKSPNNSTASFGISVWVKQQPETAYFKYSVRFWVIRLSNDFLQEVRWQEGHPICESSLVSFTFTAEILHSTPSREEL